MERNSLFDQDAIGTGFGLMTAKPSLSVSVEMWKLQGRDQGTAESVLQ